MNQSKRDIYKLCEEVSATVLDIAPNGSGHFKVEAATPAGNRFSVTFPKTPSDRRANLNQRAFLRRKIRELDGQ